MKIPPDDPRLTDYALGEMDTDTAKKFESALSGDPAAFDEVHEIRGTASALRESVATKPALGLTETQRHRILRLAEAPAPQTLNQSNKVIRPAFWGWFGKFAAGAAAAALVVAALVFAYQRGYQSAVVDAGSNPEEKGSVSKGEPAPGETPSIRIRVLDDAGTPQPVASRPLSGDSVLPVSEGQEDVFVAAVPRVRPPDPTPNPEVVVNPNPNGTGGQRPLAGSALPVASGGNGGAQDRPQSVMENPFVEVNSSPRSSFPLRARTGSYVTAATAIRDEGRLPDPASVAVEEVVNAFSYSVPGYVPTSSFPHPFAAGAEVFSCPWNPEHRLVRVTVTAFGSKEGSKGGDAKSAEDAVAVAEEIELIVEFNRTRAARYRLIGFEGAGLLSAVSATSPKARALYSGETVTALYEVVPAEGAGLLDDLRYTPHNFAAPPRDHGRELLCLSVSYTRPDIPDVLPAHTGSLVAPVIDPGLAWNRSSGDFQWAAATAAFGMVLTGSEHGGGFGFDQILTLAERALRTERNVVPGREEFLELVKRAKILEGR